MLINTYPFYGSCSFLSVSKLILNNELWVAKEDLLLHLSVGLCQIKQKQTQVLSGSFKVSQLFASGGRSIGVSASTSVLPMNIQDWFPLGWTGRISLWSKGLSRVFSNTTVQKHHFFGAQLFFFNSPTLTKVGLKLNIQKTKIMASGPITSWEINGETVTDFIFLVSKNHCRWWPQSWN